MRQRPLPRSLDDLRGLRAARWVRESTQGQFDRYGPASQHQSMDSFVERHGLIDTGLVYTAAQSGRTVWKSDAMAQMSEDARAGRFDVLLTGYFDRWQRNLRRTLELVEDVLHPSGVAWIMCDRRLVSSDPRDWDQMVTEAHESERFSRRLGDRITDGYAAKFKGVGDPGGHAGLGFRRAGDAHVLEIDPDTIGTAVALFNRYATGSVSIGQLAGEFAMTEGAVTMILRNPIYNGWVCRHRRSGTEERQPAAWRAIAPVSDALWERVAEIRARRQSLHGGPWEPDPADMLRGLLYCTCGTRIKSDGTMGTPPRRRKAHPRHRDCADWGPQEGYSASTYERWIAAQMSGLRFDSVTKAKIVRALTDTHGRVVSASKGRIDRMKRDLALDHAADRITDRRYLEQMAALRVEGETIPVHPRTDIDPEEAAAYVAGIAATWARATPDERTRLVQATYEKVTVRGSQVLRAKLTPMAEQVGLPALLPENVWVEWADARPTPVGRAITTFSGSASAKPCA
jgi:DNA invertase Pin-like site-specific DNA recombinase